MGLKEGWLGLQISGSVLPYMGKFWWRKFWLTIQIKVVGKEKFANMAVNKCAKYNFVPNTNKLVAVKIPHRMQSSLNTRR